MTKKAKMILRICGTVILAVIFLVVAYLLIFYVLYGNQSLPREGEYYCEELDCRVICTEKQVYFVAPDVLPIPVFHHDRPSRVVDGITVTESELYKMNPVELPTQSFGPGNVVRLLRFIVSARYERPLNASSFTMRFTRYPGTFEKNRAYRFERVASSREQGFPVEDWELRLLIYDLAAYRVKEDTWVEIYDETKGVVLLRFSKERTVIHNSGLELIDLPDIQALVGCTPEQLENRCGPIHYKQHYGAETYDAMYITKNGCLVFAKMTDANRVEQVDVVDLITGQKTETAE